MENELTFVSAYTEQQLDSVQLAAAQVKLWEFLGKRVYSYTMGDSSSVRIETAQNLFCSTCYVLAIDLGNPTAWKTILDWDLDQRFAMGLNTIEGKIQTAQRLWEAACLSAPKIDNISLSTTLESIGTFPKRYNYHYFAHEVPCDIDYQLCHPISETLLGVDYVIEYLRHILIEQDFLNRLDPAICIRLLKAYCPDYVGLLINLFEPVMTNAIGLAIISGDVFKLNISLNERKLISELLKPLSSVQSVQVLRSAASSVSTDLEIHQPDARRYLQDLAENLLPRIYVAENLDGIFLSF